MTVFPLPLRRGVLAALAAATTILLLAGCAQLTYEEAQASSHRVVETDRDFWGAEDWSYIGPSGTEVPLTESCREGLFSGYCWRSEDGLIEFRYSKGKSGISSERMILDGVEWPMECHREDIWDSVDVCAALN